MTPTEAYNIKKKLEKAAKWCFFAVIAFVVIIVSVLVGWQVPLLLVSFGLLYVVPYTIIQTITLLGAIARGKDQYYDKREYMCGWTVIRIIEWSKSKIADYNKKKRGNASEETQ